MPTSRQKSVLVAALFPLLGVAALTYTHRDTLGLADPPRAEQLETLRTFAKLYSYVRYFHPSDAAANTDWGRFAIHGVQLVNNAANRAEPRPDMPIERTTEGVRTGRDEIFQEALRLLSDSHSKTGHRGTYETRP
ncbi:MAG: hypothetical protein ABEL51_16285 [Salinibacter sp.]